MRIGSTTALCAAAGLEAMSALAAPAAAGDYPREGWIANFQTFQHGVRGRVVIVDENTVRLEEFDYDGGGLAGGVFLGLGTANTHPAFDNGLLFGPDLRRPTPYVDETFEVDLPPGQTLDGWNAICVWCVDISVRFGSGAFHAPPCRPDINGDGMVDSSDLAQLLALWGTSIAQGDLTSDGIVNSSDLGQLLASWGPCP